VAALPGMNSVISAATIEAGNSGWDVLGIMDGQALTPLQLLTVAPSSLIVGAPTTSAST
jgi:hypothetical protein